MYREKPMPIMLLPTRVGFVLDSASFDDALAKGNTVAEKILMYRASPLYKWIRSPYAVAHKELAKVREYRLLNAKDGFPGGIEIDGSAGPTRWTFGYGSKIIIESAKQSVNKKTVTSAEIGTVLLAFVQLVLSRRDDDYHLLVTNGEILLKNKYRLRWLGDRLNIVSIDEALLLADLLARKRGVYYVRVPLRTFGWNWYWLSFRSKVRFYYESTPILDAFASRFIYLLMSADEIAFQYYSGVTNDALDRTAYHFNYLLTLITGIFDSLAIETRDRLKLSFKGDHIPWKTSLSPSSGDDFLKAVRGTKPALRKHINDYVDFILLIYLMRELVVHREGLQKAGFESHREEKWEANILEVPKEVANLIKACGDRKSSTNPFSEWGVFAFSSKPVLVPHLFAAAATKKLVEFSNKYLEHLGFSDYVKGLPPGDGFADEIGDFQSAR